MPESPGRSGLLTELRADFTAGALAATVATGIILAMVNVLLAIALVSLIFRGELDEFLSAGIGIGIVGSALVGIVIALGSSYRGMLAGVQDASAAIIGLSAASIAGVLVGAAAFDTVVAMIVATSVVTGLSFLAMGYLGWGEIARFVPFPVIGGLLAGTGYLIVAGSIAILGVGSIGDVFAAGAIGSFWPGLMLAALFFLATRRNWSSRVYLAILVVAVVAFHVATRLAGVGRAQAMDRQWLLGPFPDGSLWPGSILGSLANADWGLILGEATSLLPILLIVPMSLLLYISGMEVEVGADIDVNQELRSTGWGNLVGGAVGGAPGYMYLAPTVIVSRLAGQRRGPAVVAPLVMLVVVVFGGFALEFLPRFIVVGMLLFVGAEFLYEWTWVARRRMATPDYLLLLGILVIIAAVGFLAGFAVGLVAAVVLFVVRYSKIDVVKHSLNGSEYRSNIERSLEELEYLREVGGAVIILELQGFVFFGTASRILAHVRARLGDAVRFVICDFRRVTGVDSSAIAIFERIVLMAREREASLVLTGLSLSQRGQFGDVISGYPGTVVVEPDLDHGVAWCEERLLEDSPTGHGAVRALPERLEEALAPYLERRTIPAGELMMRQGEPSPGIFLITSGQATVRLDGVGGEPSVRLRTLLGGTVLGEISLYRDKPCTATVVADSDCDVLHLSPERFDELCRTDTAVAAELHRFVASTLAGRVSHANDSVRALQD